MKIMTTVLDKEVLKKSLIELAENDPDYVQALFLEIKEKLSKARKQRLEEIVKEDFDEYGEVFKALA